MKPLFEKSTEDTGDRRGRSLRRRCLTAAGALLLVVLGAAVPGRLIVVSTDSVGYTLFYRKKTFSPDDIVKGSYVVFPLTFEETPDDTFLAIKKVVCAPGDDLTVKGLDYYCNGRFLGRAKTRSLTGRPVTPYSRSGKLGPGKIFVMGEHKDSYDSRYFGPKDKRDVQTMGIPLF